MDYISLIFDVLVLIGTSSVVSAALPPKYKKYIPFLEILAANVKNARNKDEP